MNHKLQIHTVQARKALPDLVLFIVLASLALHSSGRQVLSSAYFEKNDKWNLFGRYCFLITLSVVSIDVALEVSGTWFEDKQFVLEEIYIMLLVEVEDFCEIGLS